jgi:hypothetical protein
MRNEELGMAVRLLTQPNEYSIRIMQLAIVNLQSDNKPQYDNFKLKDCEAIYPPFLIPHS